MESQILNFTCLPPPYPMPFRKTGEDSLILFYAMRLGEQQLDCFSSHILCEENGLL